MKFSKNMLIALCILLSQSSLSSDLGVHGITYPIIEKNALDAIYEKLKGMERSGELKKKELEIKNKILHNIKNPKPISGITNATKKNVHYHDPTMTLSYNITTDEGKIVVPAGTVVNPLDTISLSKTLVFFSADEEEQVNAVKQLIDEYGAKIKPILVKGSWYNLTKKWDRQVYYDQDGFLTQTFKIKSVPAIVRQQGKVLEITELPVKELRP